MIDGEKFFFSQYQNGIWAKIGDRFAWSNPGVVREFVPGVISASGETRDADVFRISASSQMTKRG
jgi:hypothetical protein